MGTRSLLGVQLSADKIYWQYMQFDGGPEWKGREFYETITNTLENIRNTPGCFRTRVKHFLNEYQYGSGHSVNNHGTCTPQEWPELNSGAAWKYYWDLQGNFHGGRSGAGELSFTIPKALTEAISHSHYDLKLSTEESLLKPWWEGLSQWDSEEHPEVPSLEVQTKEVLAFPEQKEDGWRKTYRVKINGKAVYKSMFWGDGKQEPNPIGSYQPVKNTRNAKTHRATVTSDWLEVKNAKPLNLPILMTSIVADDAKALLQKRLATEPRLAA